MLLKNSADKPNTGNSDDKPNTCDLNMWQMWADLNSHFKSPVKILKILGQFETEKKKKAINIY